VVLAEDGCCAGEACVGGYAYYDFEIGESFFKLFDDGPCGVDFAEAYGVEPDTFFQCGVFAGDFAEAAGPARAVSLVSDHPIQDGWSYCRSEQQIYGVDDESHCLDDICRALICQTNRGPHGLGCFVDIESSEPKPQIMV